MFIYSEKISSVGNIDLKSKVSYVYQIGLDSVSLFFLNKCLNIFFYSYKGQLGAYNRWFMIKIEFLKLLKSRLSSLFYKIKLEKSHKRTRNVVWIYVCDANHQNTTGFNVKPSNLQIATLSLSLLLML